MSLFQVTKKQVTENYELRTMTGDIVSFTPSYSQLLPDPFSDLNVMVNVVATGGNGTPDNPNPINGYTEANITRCGANLYSNIFSEYREPVNYYIKNVPLEVGKVYTLKATLKDGGTAVSGCYFGVASKGEQYSEFLPGLYPCIKTDGTTATSTLTVTNAWTSPKLCCYVSDETQFNSIFENYDILLTEGTADFVPYNGQTYTVNFGQTVYGGVLDVTRGKLHVTWAEVDIGYVNWTYLGSLMIFYSALTNTKTTYNYNALCSCYPKSNDTSQDKVFGNTSYIGSGNNIWIKDSSFTDVATLKTSLSGQKIAYELATPFDIDLTPEVISAIVGTNNVFADCGETTVTCLI